MSKFQSGGVPVPDYDAADSTNINRKAEFTDDVFIYGKLYAALDSKDITFEDVQPFKSVRITENFSVSGLCLIHI